MARGGGVNEVQPEGIARAGRCIEVDAPGTVEGDQVAAGAVFPPDLVIGGVIVDVHPIGAVSHGASPRRVCTNVIALYDVPAGARAGDADAGVVIAREEVAGPEDRAADGVVARAVGDVDPVAAPAAPIGQRGVPGGVGADAV